LLISHKHKIIWVCVPGTGTRSFERIAISHHHFEHLKVDKSRKTDITMPLHYPARVTKSYIEKNCWDSYEKIAFIRNPYTWMNSMWNHFQLKNVGMIKEELVEVTFNNFVVFNKKTPYYWYLDWNDTMLIDTLYKTEELDTVFFPRFGQPPIHNNQTSHGKEPQVYTPELKKIMQERFWREFEHYVPVS